MTDDYPPDGVGAIPAGVRIRCEPCMRIFVLRGGGPISCPYCGAVLAAILPASLVAAVDRASRPLISSEGGAGADGGSRQNQAEDDRKP
jgi:hypothetical protein